MEDRPELSVEMPTELDELLQGRVHAAEGWRSAAPEVRLLYAGWIAKSRLRHQRRRRAENTATWAARGRLGDHVTHVTNSPWDWVIEAAFAFLSW